MKNRIRTAAVEGSASQAISLTILEICIHEDFKFTCLQIIIQRSAQTFFRVRTSMADDHIIYWATLQPFLSAARGIHSPSLHLKPAIGKWGQGRLYFLFHGRVPKKPDFDWNWRCENLWDCFNVHVMSMQKDLWRNHRDAYKIYEHWPIGITSLSGQLTD